MRCTAVMTWLFMPGVTGLFRRWLDPVDGAGRRVSLIGAGVAIAAVGSALAGLGAAETAAFAAAAVAVLFAGFVSRR